MSFEIVFHSHVSKKKHEASLVLTVYLIQRIANCQKILLAFRAGGFEKSTGPKKNLPARALNTKHKSCKNQIIPKVFELLPARANIYRPWAGRPPPLLFFVNIFMTEMKISYHI